LKNKDTLLLAVAKFTDELNKVRERLDWTKSWLDAANFMQEPSLFVAQVEERKDLQKREQELDFKIRFVKWVLEDNKPKENENGKENTERSM
jgi:hypothetical protein